jgi:hypothetical protein
LHDFWIKIKNETLLKVPSGREEKTQNKKPKIEKLKNFGQVSQNERM